MVSVAVKFTAPELRLLATLAADQLFRREFIDLRLPGHQANAEELTNGKRLVERLLLKAKEAERMMPSDQKRRRWTRGPAIAL